MHYLFVQSAYMFLALRRVSLPNYRLKQCEHGLLDSLLYEPELFIALVPENLSEQRHLMVILGVLLDARDYRSCPLNNQVLQTIPLVEVSIHILLHGLLGLLAFLAFQVKFHLVSIHVVDKLFQLLQRQGALLSWTDRH